VSRFLVTLVLNNEKIKRPTAIKRIMKDVLFKNTIHDHDFVFIIFIEIIYFPNISQANSL